jgi:hypothetical protein
VTCCSMSNLRAISGTLARPRLPANHFPALRLCAAAGIVAHDMLRYCRHSSSWHVTVLQA